VIRDYPPIYDEILAAFPNITDDVVFSWGNKIYAPGFASEIPPEIHWHEGVHGYRQGNDIVGWWHRYIDDVEFRLAEEIPAHQKEFQYIYEHENRAMRRRMLNMIASKLSSPLYGKMITPTQAKKIIKEVLNG